MNWLVNLLVVAVPAAAAVTAAIIAGRYAKSSKVSELEAQRLRDLEQRISERKYDVYKPMLELLGQVLTSDKKKQHAVLQGVPEKTRTFASWISIYGSDDAVRASRNFIQAGFASAPSKIMLRLYAEFLMAARRDIGYTDTGVSVEDLLGMRINDLYSDDTRWYLTDPFEAVCKRLGWSPPWLAGNEFGVGLPKQVSAAG